MILNGRCTVSSTQRHNVGLIGQHACFSVHLASAHACTSTHTHLYPAHAALSPGVNKHLHTRAPVISHAQLKVRDMQDENERLRRDNERFVRLIDSGEWGRGRVSELVSAGEILKGERDALLKLIQVCSLFCLRVLCDVCFRSSWRCKWSRT